MQELQSALQRWTEEVPEGLSCNRPPVVINYCMMMSLKLLIETPLLVLKIHIFKSRNIMYVCGCLRDWVEFSNFRIAFPCGHRSDRATADNREGVLWTTPACGRKQCDVVWRPCAL